MAAKTEKTEKIKNVVVAGHCDLQQVVKIEVKGQVDVTAGYDTVFGACQTDAEAIATALFKALPSATWQALKRTMNCI